MHEQDVAGGEVGEEILGATAEAFDGLAFEPRHEVLRQRPAQVGAPGFDAGKARPFHHGRKTAAHRLDFGQLWHENVSGAET